MIAIMASSSGMGAATLRRWLLGVCTTAAVAAVTALASSASAQAPAFGDGEASPYASLLPVRIDGHAALSWDGELGVGGRADIPVLGGGMLYGTRDELCISVGLDAMFIAFEGSNPRTFWPTATVQWSLGVSERFAFFPEFGIVGVIDRGEWDGALPNVGFGGRYYVWRSVSFSGRLGWPVALSAGLTF